MKSGQTRAATLRATNRAATLEKLRNLGLLQHVVETTNKLANLDIQLDATEVQRLKAANDTRMALIKKYLPDVKQVELTGEDGEAIQVDNTFKIEFVSADAKD